jgi:hypothetical protein
MKVKTATLIALFIAFWIGSTAQYFNVGSPSSDTLQIPFIERFISGSLEINNWVADCENWLIESDSGNPAPSVSFNGQPGIYSDYNCALTSDWISTKNATDRIYIRFDYKFSYLNFSDNDTLFIEVFDSVNWHTIRKLYHPEDNWRHLDRKLTPYITAAHFKIRFRASGLNTSNIDYWAIDNIFVYDGVWFPEQLEGNYIWEEEFGVKLDWYYQHPIGEWGMLPLSYAYDGVEGSIGISAGGDWAYAAKWDSVGPDFNNTYFLRMTAYLGDIDFDSLVLKVWRGQNGEILQYSDNVTSEAKEDQWNIFYIAPPLFITDTSPSWFGFVVYGQPPGSFPAGNSSNEAVNGYGNLYKPYLDGGWDTLPEMLNNWSLQMNLKCSSGYYRLEGYNVYRKDEDDTAYQLRAFVKSSYIDEVSFIEKYPDVNIHESYTYQVKNTWVNQWVIPTDTMFSLPAYAKINGDEDFVTILVTHYPEQQKKGTSLTAFPNPTATMLNIKSESELKVIHIFNLLGQKVGEFAANNEKQMKIDVSGLQKGVYLLKIETETGFISRKFVVE